MIYWMLFVIIVLLCHKQEERFLTLIGMGVVIFLAEYVIPFVVGVVGGSVGWLSSSKGEVTLNAWLLIGVVVLFVIVKFALRKLPNKEEL